jgi:hypothetical protein
MLSAELHNGRGFFVLRGFPVDSFNRFECVLAYAGVSAYIGSLRGWQDKTGAVLAHITDLSATHAVGTPAYTNEKQVFHTDNGDIVSLLALDVADEGGTSKISSSWQVYNVLAETRPDLIKTLSEDWPCDKYAKLRLQPVSFILFRVCADIFELRRRAGILLEADSIFHY